MRLGDLAAEGQPDARSVRLRGEEGHEQVGGVRDPRSLVLDEHLDVEGGDSPPDAHAAPRLRDGVDRVVQQVDEHLVQLIRVGPNDDVGARLHSHREPGLELRHAADPCLDVHRIQLRWRQARQPGVGGHEPAQGGGPARDDPESLLHVRGLERRPAVSEAVPQALGDGADGGERVVDLVPQHPNQSAPRLALLLAEDPAQVRQDQQRLGPALVAEAGAPDLPAARAAREGHLDHPRRVAGQEGRQSDGAGGTARERPGRPVQELGPGPVDQPQTVVRVEGEHGHVDLLEHAPQEGRGLQRPDAFGSQRLAERVHLVRDEAERPVGALGPNAHRVVPPAESGQHVGQGLEGPDELVVEDGDEGDPGADEENGRDDPRPRRPRRPPQEQESQQNGGQARDEGEGGQAALVAHRPSLRARGRSGPAAGTGRCG